MITTELSKKVGWSPRKLKFPTLEQVKIASDYKLLEWNRFLERPKDKTEQEVLNLIMSRLWRNEK